MRFDIETAANDALAALLDDNKKHILEDKQTGYQLRVVSEKKSLGFGLGETASEFAFGPPWIRDCREVRKETLE